ncbi:1138_t:CDS:2 [Entrophospora sp. SA101]|nr:1138_t:CDS:2 [Entrophospora sp. SA101]
MSTTSLSSYSRRKPVPNPDRDFGGNNNNNNSNNNPTGDLNFLNQAPKAPVKSPLRSSGSNVNIPITGSTQTTIVQPVISTMAITSTSQPVTIIKPKPLKSTPSIDTNSIKSHNSRDRVLPAIPSPDSGSEYEESVKSVKRRDSINSYNTIASPTTQSLYENSLISSSPTSTGKVKLPTLAIANDILANSEAMLTTSNQRFTSMSFLDTTDEMLLQLLVSQAIIDSKGFDLLSLEEVEELKKDYTVLTTRIAALTAKLSLESKIREAASSLAKLHASNKRISRQATDHLMQANRKVDQVAAELWKLTQRAGDIQRKLLQHMSGVLSLGITRLEGKPTRSQSIQLVNSLSTMPNSNDSNNIDVLYNELIALNDSRSSDQVSSLEASLQSVRQSLSEAKNLIKRKDKEIEDLRAKFNDASAGEHEGIQKIKVIELESKIKQIKVLEDQVSEMRKKEKSNTNLDLKLKKVTREYEEMFDSIQQLFNDLNNSDNGYKKSSKSGSEFNLNLFVSMVNDKIKENRELIENVSLLQEEAKIIQQQLKEAKQQEKLRKELQDTQNELEETKAKLADLEEKILNEKSKVESTSEREEELRKEIEDLNQQLNNSKEKIRKYEATLRRESVLQFVNEGTSAKEEFQQQLESQEQEYEGQLKERDAVITKLRKDFKAVSTEKDNLLQTVNELNLMLKSKSRTLDQREVTINNLESEVVKLKSDLEARIELSKANKYNNRSGDTSENDAKQLKIQLDAAHEELKNLRAAKEDLEAQLKDALEKSNAGIQNELDGLLKEFDRLTRNFMDFDTERQKLEKQIDTLQRKCEQLENGLADERIKHIGLDSNNNEPTTTTALRKEFRKMMADLRSEQQKQISKEQEERKKSEDMIRNLKREKEAEKWERVNQGTQTKFVVEMISG